ncbi:hypothetical protein MANY_19700 [Mycolicibacterium anyangense]|uniref:TPM domain-containing protein n=1 Tax=Mycolicibacterium anyangense TaxID=1431246 RepID=A0A6N4W8H9_9MYCO|nr:TPM domain-containing protein [Mycolicibacterium anyangense]BBZ76633.1 hypothetical protein MANY_19700 [Mycolicibacterium anyangense]
MYFGRLLSLLGVILTVATLVAPAATAEPPFRLPGYVTDDLGILTPGQRTDVQNAVEALYRDRHIRLWVVYVESFSPLTSPSWTQATREASDLGALDAILAVAVLDRSYYFQVPSDAVGGAAADVDALRRDKIEPALHNNHWADAAIAAADGLTTVGTSSSSRFWVKPLLIGLTVIVLAVSAWLLWSYRRSRKRHAAQLAAAKRVDPTDPKALAAIPLDVLDDLSKSIVVDVDNAVRTSTNELALATQEFGRQETEPFTKAVENAKSALRQAFNVRLVLDDEDFETPEERRKLLTRVVTAAARANRELDAQTESFHKLRDLVLNASDRLDTLTQKLVDISTRVDPARAKLTQLRTEFAETALVSVAPNADAAKERLHFADHSIGRARELVARPPTGPQIELVDCVRGAESALQQAGSMLDSVDSAATDIRSAVATLPSVIADVQEGIDEAAAQLAKGGLSDTAKLTTTHDAAVTAVTAAKDNGAADPLGTLTDLTEADADLDHVLDEVAEERKTAQRLNRSFDKALLTAQSRVRSVSDYIDTRRGSVGPEARTRLNAAERQLETAQAKQKTNIAEAIAYANRASKLAAQAQQLANDDVEWTQQRYMNNNAGQRDPIETAAVVGGLILRAFTAGASAAGSSQGGGWTSTSYGGSSGGSSGSYGGSSGSSGGGGMLGGGGRF